VKYIWKKGKGKEKHIDPNFDYFYLVLQHKFNTCKCLYRMMGRFVVLVTFALCNDLIRFLKGNNRLSIVLNTVKPDSSLFYVVCRHVAREWLFRGLLAVIELPSFPQQKSEVLRPELNEALFVVFVNCLLSGVPQNRTRKKS
jgi:hypothetical protein